MNKVLIVFGTRPEAIKMAPIIKQFQSASSKFKPVICSTAQHRRMLDQVLDIFHIKPDYDLNIMKERQDLFDITTYSLSGLRNILTKERPDLVLIQGDTTTAFTAGLAAYYFKIPIGHIEAGLRTHNKYSPYPEEKNRHLVSTLTDYHFAPTEWAKDNLLREGIPEDNIWVTGNTVIDSLHFILDRQKPEHIQTHWNDYFRDKWNIQLSVEASESKLLLVTGHRRENFGKGIESICMALKTIAEARRDINIVYPLHLNPNIKEPVKAILDSHPNIYLIDPLEYEPFVYLMNNAYLVLSDSGGVQEETPSLGKPLLILRNTTERPEGIEAGTSKLVSADKDKIIHATLELLDSPTAYKKMSKRVNAYGDGNAARKIVEILERESITNELTKIRSKSKIFAK